MPLNLSAAEQNALAEFCTLARSVKYALDTNGETYAKDTHESVCDLVERHRLSAQDYDRLYDKLHRSGANEEKPPKD